MSLTEGPYQSPTPVPPYPSVTNAVSTVCLVVWLTGTFALSLVCVADTLFQLRLPEVVLYVVLVASPAATFLASMLAPIRLYLRVLYFLVSIMLMFTQFVVWFFVALATSGFDGIH